MTPLILSCRLREAAAARGVDLAGIQPLAGDGSERRFFRLPGESNLILLYQPRPPGNGVNENDSYFFIGRHLWALGVPVPEIHEYCREEGWLLLEDVGDRSLFGAVAKTRDENLILKWYQKALEILLHQQVAGKQGFNPAWCFDTPRITRDFLWERECRYFVRAFLQGYLGLEVGERDLAPDFAHLLARARPETETFFLHRDFQSKNLFLKGKSLRILDFQGGRLGPLGYDVAALLIDPYVNLSKKRQETLLQEYVKLLKTRCFWASEKFEENYPYLALCRNLQILGAFAFLAKVKGKNQFVPYISPALSGLRQRLAERQGEFPLLERITENIELPKANGG